MYTEWVSFHNQPFKDLEFNSSSLIYPSFSPLPEVAPVVRCSCSASASSAVGSWEAVQVVLACIALEIKGDGNHSLI